MKTRCEQAACRWPKSRRAKRSRVPFAAHAASPTRVRPRQLLLMMLLSMCLLLESRLAQSAELIPAPDGHVGVFLVLGPLHPKAPTTDFGALEPHLGRYAQGLGTWQLLAHGKGALDLAKRLNTKRVGSQVVVAGVLELPNSFDGWLLLSVDGTARVAIDGTLVATFAHDRLRADSWDTVPVRLAAGRHVVSLLLEHPGRHWALQARWLARENMRPPAGARWVLDGTSAQLDRFIGSQLLSTRLWTTIDDAGFTPSVELGFDRGALAADTLPASIKSRPPGSQWQEHRLGSLSVNAHGIHPLSAALPRISVASLPQGTHLARFRLQVGPHGVGAEVAIDPGAVELVRRAEQLRHSLAGASLPAKVGDLLAATLDYRLRQLNEATESGQAFLLRQAMRELEALLAETAQDPLFALRPGVHRLAHRSSLDGRPQSFWLHVPSGFVPGTQKRYPLVLALHGYNGSPQGIIEAFLDSKSRSAKAEVDGFVVAPEAHGNTFYRGPGEYEAMSVLRLVRETFPIDEARISVTGVSMGGTGAAQLALRYSDTFAAAAPFCGYHSYFIRRDTRDRQLRDWERGRMHHWSTSSWAANGRHLPLFVAHGTQDHPLENSKVLIRAYRQLGFSVQEEWPDIGHFVWTISYRGARMWRWLTSHTRPERPDHFNIYTDALRYGARYWAAIERLERYGMPASLEVERRSAGRIEVRTANVQRFRLDPQPHGPVEVVVDGQQLDFAPGAAVQLARSASWQASGHVDEASQFVKRAGSEGPIRDAFLGPVAFVYGTLSASSWRANREVAERFGRYHQGVTLDYPVLADRDVTPELIRRSSLVLVGNARDHLILGRLNERLPARHVSSGLQFGGEVYRGEDLGAVYIYPNPEAPERYIVVITGSEVGGILRALSLPRLLPDFVVYDVGLRAAAGEQLLGSASVLRAGYFTHEWQVPERTP